MRILLVGFLAAGIFGVSAGEVTFAGDQEDSETRIADSFILSETEMDSVTGLGILLPNGNVVFGGNNLPNGNPHPALVKGVPTQGPWQAHKRSPVL